MIGVDGAIPPTGRVTPPLRLVLLAGVLTATAICTDPAPVAVQEDYDYGANCVSWPAVEGPHPVGTAEFEVTDSLHAAQYAPSPTDHRRIYVRAWYPAAEAGATDPRPYLSSAEATILPSQLLPALQQPADALRGCVALPSNSHQDAAPAPGRYPVIGFNHGYTSYPAQQSALFEHLAANGYVVLSVGHPYESGGLVYPNGDAVTMSPRILQDMARYAGATESMTVHYPPSLGEALDAFPAYLRTLRTTSLGQLAQVWQSGFLDRYVKGTDSDYPAGALARYPELMVRNRDDIRRQAEALGMGPHSYGWDALGMPVPR